MNCHTDNRPQWEIDRVLGRLLNHNIRVAAESFSPIQWNGEALPRMIPTSEIILADNSKPAGLPVFFEGKLLRFNRQVGVIVLLLGSLDLPHEPAQGLIYFRGRSVVILDGPATVRLSVPVMIERIPTDAKSYWADLRAPRVQFELHLDG